MNLFQRLCSNVGAAQLIASEDLLAGDANCLAAQVDGLHPRAIGHGPKAVSARGGHTIELVIQVEEPGAVSLSGNHPDGEFHKIVCSLQ